MAKSAKLVIGSLEAYSGKSAVIVGLAHLLGKQGLDLVYSKPVSGGLDSDDETDEDVPFLAETLGLKADRILPPILMLDSTAAQKRLTQVDQQNYGDRLQQQLSDQAGDLILLEGAGSLEEGCLFDLSLVQMAEVVDASVLLVTCFRSMEMLDGLLVAKQQLGDRLLGVVINDVSSEKLNTVHEQICPFLEQQNIPVFGVLPSSTLLRSVTVAELVHQLKAEVLCRGDRLDLMVESLTIGAMNVNSALRYFRQGHNMAVVTGGDRTDLQWAAMETSTQCLILTGHIPPTKTVITRAEELEIPILSVDLDTLTTVEIIEHAFGHVRLHEPVKVQCVREMSAVHLHCDRLLAELGLTVGA
ncbi:MAG: phosphotransacetylase family protein [Synechococcales bacterium]|nr:phosphotransacetylase family protein [Synechococcales bacterium]